LFQLFYTDKGIQAGFDFKTRFLRKSADYNKALRQIHSFYLRLTSLTIIETIGRKKENEKKRKSGLN